MLLTIIIVSYNTRDLTIQTIKSAATDILRSPSLREKSEIIVVDNHSEDGSVEKISAQKKEFSIPIKIIKNEKNLGFAAANNQAINKAKGQYILLLNSDTYVQAGALQKMIHSFEGFANHPSTAVLSTESRTLDKLGILSASLINWDGTYQPQGGDLPNLLTLSMQMLFIDDIPLLGRFLPTTQHTGKSTRPQSMNSYDQDQRLIKKGWVAGTAMMIDRAVIKEIGDLDHNIFMYGEDMEFCLRASQHHWDIAEHPTARITHFQSSSSSSANAIIGEIKGLYYIWSKHKPLWQLPFLKAILQLGLMLRWFIFGTIRGNSENVELYQAALKAIPRK